MTQVAFAILLAHLQRAAGIQQCDYHTQLLSYKRTVGPQLSLCSKSTICFLDASVTKPSLLNA